MNESVCGAYVALAGIADGLPHTVTMELRNRKTPICHVFFECP